MHEIERPLLVGSRVHRQRGAHRKRPVIPS
jgi:hypothetical protein